MDHFSFLETTAEISIAIAGFASIFLVLARRDGSFPPEHALTIRSNLLTSVGCMFYAALPIVLSGFGLAETLLWRVSSSIFLIMLLASAVFMGVNRRKLPPGVQGTVYARIAWTLASLTMVGLVSNLAGWPRQPDGSLYVLSVWAALGIAATNFLDLVFRGVLGSSRA